MTSRLWWKGLAFGIIVSLIIFFPLKDKIKSRLLKDEGTKSRKSGPLFAIYYFSANYIEIKNSIKYSNNMKKPSFFLLGIRA